MARLVTTGDLLYRQTRGDRSNPESLSAPLRPNRPCLFTSTKSSTGAAARRAIVGRGRSICSSLLVDFQRYTSSISRWLEGPFPGVCRAGQARTTSAEFYSVAAHRRNSLAAYRGKSRAWL